jgi:GT2 family glycosyltransferase
MGAVCVEVAVRDDPRLLDALASLDRQERRPDRVLVATSPATPQALLDEARRRFPALPLVFGRYPNGPVEARSASLPDIVEPVTAFLDSDERAPPEWLRLLVAPIESGTADFSGGPTKPLRPPEGSLERYSVLLEESIYADLVPQRVSYLPLQNTAWRTDLLRQLGIDPRISAEDHDLETRAAQLGKVGLYVPNAWVYHDKGTESSFSRWARKRFHYQVGMAMSLMKNGELGGRLAERRRPVNHPLRFVEAGLKPFAFLTAMVRWHRVSTPAERERRRPPSPKAPDPRQSDRA